MRRAYIAAQGLDDGDDDRVDLDHLAIDTQNLQNDRCKRDTIFDLFRLNLQTVTETKVPVEGPNIVRYDFSGLEDLSRLERMCEIADACWVERMPVETQLLGLLRGGEGHLQIRLWAGLSPGMRSLGTGFSERTCRAV